MRTTLAGMVHVAGATAEPPLAREVNELAPPAIALRSPFRPPWLCHIGECVMVQALPSMWLVLGASSLALTMRIAIPPVAWAALLFLLHTSRSLTGAGGIIWFWLAVYASVLVGIRPSLPVSGAIYFAISAFVATTIALPFLFDRIMVQRA